MENANQAHAANAMGAEHQSLDTVSAQTFWAEIAPSEHVVQFYESDNLFLDTLETFAASGLKNGEAVVIIGTPSHVRTLNERLIARDLDLENLKRHDQYIPLDAEQTLAQFMVNNWPDAAKFRAAIGNILVRARRGAKNGKVRAFGEMVALLWDRGLNGATVYLEGLWNDLHKRKDFSLYCAYPKTGFTQSKNAAMDMIIKSHQRVIEHKSAPHTEIYYRDR